MVDLSIRAKIAMTDLKKRAAREYALGFLTKDELDVFCKCQDEMEKIVNKCEKRHNEEGK